MNMVINGEWVTDVKKMTCRNKNNNIVILFKKINGNLVGEIKTLPMKIVNKWATEGQGGDKDLKNTVTEAELMFYKAYFENEGIKIN